MKKIMGSWLVFLTLTSAFGTLKAKESVNTPAQPNSTVRASFKTEAGDCVPSTDQFDLDINNVRARLLGGGDMWWDFNGPKYEVPKGDGTTPALDAIFAGSIWITGVDAGGNLKCAGVTYRQRGNDYWPGPLAADGTIDKATCSIYDRHFSVLGVDILKAQTAFINKGPATTVSDIPSAVLAWPAKGNQYLLSDATLIGQTLNITDNLAPFKDVDGDGIYDPVKGDFPVIPCRHGESKAYGDQMVFWVFNDVGNVHSETNGQAIGVQVNSLAFAFQTTDDINSMTFYHYEVQNKSANKLFQTYVSQWVDPDLGCAFNDRVGCDVARSLGICYNGSTTDASCQNENGYGTQLPLVGVDFFEGPLGDDSAHTELGLTSFVYFTNGAAPAKSDPSSAPQFRNYQTGFWADGTPFTFGGTGYNSGGPVTKFIFPGNPIDATQWSEVQPTINLPADDRRFVQSSGPFTLTPGIPQTVTVGAVFVRPPGGVGVPPNFATTIGPADDKAQALFNTCFKLLDGPDAPTLQIRELDKQVIINFQNLPGSNNVGEAYRQVDGVTAQNVYGFLNGHGDSTYAFQGYDLYQLKTPTVAATDLNDPTKALLVAQVDVKDGISKIINFIKDATLGLYIPTLKVDGKDQGISNTFNITTDLFASGSSNLLVNHKTYYYAAIAYAYNNYIQYDATTLFDSTNRTRPSQAGQLLPYLQGRNNFKIYSAIPHIADPRNEGTILHTQWGEGVEVKRIEGQGNGGSLLQLTDETIAEILASPGNFADTLTYIKGYDPIGFKVTDPLTLKEADFELQIIDTVTRPVGTTSKWLLHDLTNNDTIWSERNLDRPYPQQIAFTNGSERTEYGFSITLGTPTPKYVIPGAYLGLGGTPDRYAYDVSESSIQYDDSIHKWLSFLADAGTSEAANWIRTGGTSAMNNPATSAPASSQAAAEAYDPNFYFVGNPPSPVYGSASLIFDDPDGIFGNILGGTWAPYCLTANYAKEYLTAPEITVRKPNFVYGPGFKWWDYGNYAYPPQNTLDTVPSVDIVITPDQSKWSRCVVFETGEDEHNNQGQALVTNYTQPGAIPIGARKGQIRMQFSKDLDGNGHMVAVQNDTGRSWFPGYAINVETGERLNIAFGESSDMGDQNGRDMLWNPTENVYSPFFSPIFGGKHFIYIMNSRYDAGAAAQRLLLDNYKNVGASTPWQVPAVLRPFYTSLMWTSIPYLSPGFSLKDDGAGNKCIPPSAIAVHLRVEKQYKRMRTSASTGPDILPRYQFSTKGMGITEGDQTVAKSALDLIRVVPNPYLAYSAYETDQNTSTVKVTNLPNNCTITIYSLDGTLIRKLSRAIGVDPATNKRVEISDGVSINDKTNVEGTVDWDLKNDKSIQISSGIYLFHIEAPGLGERTIKWFGAVRPADTSQF